MDNDIDNPYAPPAAAPADAFDDAPYMPSWFSVQGRIGRLRYLVYSLIPAVLLLLLLAYLVGPRGLGRGLRIELLLGFLAAALAIWAVMTRRRLGDIALPGWWALLVLLPGVNVALAAYLLFRRGDAGGNIDGAPPAANTTMVGSGVWLLLLMLITAGAAQFELG